MSISRGGPVRRSLRRFALGSGPLKRRSDRLEAAGRLAVVVSFLAAPPLAVAVMTATTTHLQSVAAAEAADRSRAQAVLLQDAPPPTAAEASTAANGYAVTRVHANAEWTTPAGAPRDGTVLVAPGTPAGKALTIWVDRAGRLTDAPLDGTGVAASAASVAVLPLVGLPLLAWTCHGCLCFVLNVRRERRWAQDWAAVEPQWNSRFR
ncbi:MAG TPA: hypothetical protein VGN28_15945 [Blastococcus sp.]|jgi:hypothetical protein|nr:hypothetical protein [Blastococcus sp.]